MSPKSIINIVSSFYKQHSLKCSLFNKICSLFKIFHWPIESIKNECPQRLRVGKGRSYEKSLWIFELARVFRPTKSLCGLRIPSGRYRISYSRDGIDEVNKVVYLLQFVKYSSTSTVIEADQKEFQKNYLPYVLRIDGHVLNVHDHSLW